MICAAALMEVVSSIFIPAIALPIIILSPTLLLITLLLKAVSSAVAHSNLINFVSPIASFFFSQAPSFSMFSLLNFLIQL